MTIWEKGFSSKIEQYSRTGEILLTHFDSKIVHFGQELTELWPFENWGSKFTEWGHNGWWVWGQFLTKIDTFWIKIGQQNLPCTAISLLEPYIELGWPHGVAVGHHIEAKLWPPCVERVCNGWGQYLLCTLQAPIYISTHTNAIFDSSKNKISVPP